MAQKHTGAYTRRTAQRNAAFFLPHLKEGMRLLDVGCGPGSITIGLAAAIAPGEAAGIDASGEAIELARARAAEQGCGNVAFETGDVYALPFEDATFDAAFMHAVLQHLSDPAAALSEVRRVLKPGGVLGVADADYDGSIIAPEDPLLHRGFAINAELRARTRGDVHVGKHLRELMHDAGFSRTVASVVGGADGSDDAARFMGEFEAQGYEAPAFVDYVTALGISTPDEMGAVADAWRRWSTAPGAFWARFWCQCVAWNGS